MAHVPEVSPVLARRAFGYAVVFFLVYFLAVGLSHASPQTADTTKVDTSAAAAKQAPPAACVLLPRMCIRLDKGGEIVIELYPKEAPKAVERIVSLVESKFYDALRFHRVESYVVQTGAVETELAPVEGEMFGQKLTHEEGMVGMARLPDDYDSAKTQFYICKKHLPLMNGEYTLFGKVVSGIELVHKIKRGDAVKSITMVE